MYEIANVQHASADLLKVPTEEVTNQIMECDVKMFCKIGVRDLVVGQNNDQGPNVTKLITNFNWVCDLSYYLMTFLNTGG